MSTRAHVLVKGKRKTNYIYHHCDGYPEGIGRDLKNFLKRYPKWDITQVTHRILSGVCAGDNDYELDEGLHGDEEFIYVIDCVKRKLKCYRHGWDESEEECIKRENEERI